AMPEVVAAREAMEQARDPEVRGRLATSYDALRREKISIAEEAQAARFDAEHSVERARRMGAVDEVIAPARLRERIIHHLEGAIQKYLARRAGEEERADREIADTILAHQPIDALRVLRESLIRQYGETRAREIAGQLGEGLLRLAK